MGKLTELISERRRRQENPDRVIAIFRTFIDPATKREAPDLPRLAIVIGGPRLYQTPGETGEAFKARVMAVANQLNRESKTIN